MTTVVAKIAASILALRRDRPVRVLVDGRSAAGKTTFSAPLGEALASASREVVTIHFDDFHPVGYAARGSSAYSPARYLEAGFDFQSFERLVLAPTTHGASCRVRRALAGVFDDAPKGTARLAAGDILLVEGAFLLKPALRHWWDFAIWLDISFETMVERACARDVAWVGDADKVRARYQTFWKVTHSLYEACGARDAAHVVVDNEDPANPRVLRWAPPS